MFAIQEGYAIDTDYYLQNQLKNPIVKLFAVQTLYPKPNTLELLALVLFLTEEPCLCFLQPMIANPETTLFGVGGKGTGAGYEAKPSSVLRP